MVVLPDFLGHDSGVIPIELLTSRDLELHVLSGKRAHVDSGSDQSSDESYSEKNPFDPMFLRRKAAELSLAESLKTPSPSIPNPWKSAGVSQDDRVKEIANSPFYKELARTFAQNRSFRTHAYQSLESSIDASPETLKSETFDTDPGTERILSQLGSADEALSSDLAVWKKLGIRGPAVQRKLAFLPAPPPVKIGGEAELEIEFCVRPNGTVDRVVPVTPSGNAELEKIATTYVGQWRFEPLPESEHQADTWGTVTIRITPE
jgi:TonB family protein